MKRLDKSSHPVMTLKTAQTINLELLELTLFIFEKVPTISYQTIFWNFFSKCMFLHDSFDGIFKKST